MPLRELTSQELSDFAGGNDPSLIEVDAPNNTVFDEKNNRVLSLPQTLDADETQFVIHRDIDGKSQFFAQQPVDGVGLPAPKPKAVGPAAMYSAENMPSAIRGIGAFFASLPSVWGGFKLEQGEGFITGRESPFRIPANSTAGMFMTSGDYIETDQEEAIRKRIGEAVAEDGQAIIDRNRKYMAESGWAKREGDGIMYDIGQGVGSLLTSLGVAGLTRSPTAAALMFGAIQKSNIYVEARQSGMEPDAASGVSTVAGVAEGALEKVGLDRFMKGMAANSAVKRFVTGFVTESVQEGTQQAAESLITNVTDIRNQKPSEVAKDILYSAALGGVIGGPTNVALGHFVKDEAKQRGLSDAEAEALGKYAEENIDPVRKDVGEFIRKEVAPIAADNKSAMEFMTLMQKFDNRLDVIDPEALNPEQRAVFDEYVGYFNSSTADKTGVAGVEKAFYDQLTTSGVDQEQAVGASKLMGARADAASRALGVTPKEWFDSHNLVVEVKRTPDQAKTIYQEKLDEIRARDLADTQARLDALRQPDTTSTSTKTKQPLLTYLKKNGGIHVDSQVAGELRNMGVTHTKAPGLFRKSGGMGELDNIPASEFNERFGVTAEEDGNGYVDRDWLLNQIDEELRGRPIGAKQEAVQKDEGFMRAIEGAGLDPATATAEQVYGALGPEGDVIAQAKVMGEEINPQQAREILGVQADEKLSSIDQAIERWQERQGIQTFNQSATPEFDEARAQELTDKAKELTGTTTNPMEAGYITIDGGMLDLSGRHYALGYEKVDGKFVPDGKDYLAGHRAVDHREVSSELMDEGGTQGMLDFMTQARAIRVDFASGQVNSTFMPSAKQIAAIVAAAKRAGTESLNVELSRPDNGEVKSQAYVERITPANVKKVFAGNMFNETLFQKAFDDRVTAMIRSSLQEMVNGEIKIKDKTGFMNRAARGELMGVERRELPHDLVRMSDSLHARMAETMQRLNQTSRGSITFTPDKTIITLFENADPSTLLHELGHLFLRDMRNIAQTSKRPMVQKDWQDVKKWLGAKSYHLTEAQEEKFARGFEAYLREGKAPKPELQSVFDRFKQWLTQIYKNVSKLDVKINDDIRQVFDRMLGGDFARSEATIIARGEAKVADDYDRVSAPPPSSFGGDVSNILSSGKELAADMFSPVSYRLGKIHPKLKAALRKFTFKNGLNVQQDREKVLPFLNAIEGMSDKDYRKLDFALKNRDTAKTDELVKKYKAEDAYAAVKELLDEIHVAAGKVGMDLAYLQDYFPRMVRLSSAKEYLNTLRGTPNWSAIAEAADAEQKKQGVLWTDEEMAVFANKYLRGLPPGTTNALKPSFTKARKIDYVEPEHNKFYLPSGEALLQYISAMRLGISQREIFGKGENSQESIGAYVASMIKQGVINHEQEAEVKKIMNAVINSRGPGVFVSWMKNAGYVYLMGSPISAITQIQDLGFSLAKNGYYRTAVSFTKALSGNSILTKEELGIDNIAREFEDETRASKAVRLVFKAIGLEWVDNIGKQVYIEASFKRLQAQAKTNSASFQEYMSNIFGDEAESVRADLLSGTISDNVKELLYSELSDVQPVSLAEMPVGYLRGGNLRSLYMLKTYTIKQVEIYRREVFDKMASGDMQQVKEGTQMLVRLAVALMLMGMGADALKDLLLGRPIDLSNLVVDNIYKTMGITKYQIYQTRQDGVANTMMQYIFVPPLYAPVDNLIKDAQKISDGKMKPKDAQSLSYIPGIGKFYYWWYGEGRAKIEKQKKKGKN